MTKTKVAAVVTTYFPPGNAGAYRVMVAFETMKSWNEKMGIDRFYVEDDGSPVEHLEALRVAQQALPATVTFDIRLRRGVGASLNRGLRRAFADGYIAFYGVDDWKLTQPLDLAPWVDLLTRSDAYGCIRLGPPHPGNLGEVVMTEYSWILHLSTYGFVAAQRPALWHPRFFDIHGWWPENCSALECERMFNQRYAESVEKVAIALAIPSPFAHLRSVELSAVDPSLESTHGIR